MEEDDPLEEGGEEGGEAGGAGGGGLNAPQGVVGDRAGGVELHVGVDARVGVGRLHGDWRLRMERG